MGEAIVITSGKGGVGKTTICANIAVALSMLGKRTGVIDMDIGLRNLDVVLGLEDKVMYNILDVANRKCRLKQALIRDKRYPGLYILAAAQTADKDDLSLKNALEVVNEMKELFDYTLIDCPAGIERGFKNSVAAADRAVLVTTPEISAVRDADRVLGLIGKNKDPKLIVNKLKPEMVKRGEIMSVDDIVDILNTELIGIIPDVGDVIVSSNSGLPVAALSESVSGRAIRNISRRLLGESVPFLDSEAKVSAIKRIAAFIGL